MAELFDVQIPAISKHLQNIYDEEELDKDSTISKMETVQMEGLREVIRTREFYNLDVIIAVGYRVNSRKATKFRQWATKTLKEYIQKGFVLNDDLMKNGRPFGKDYFDELLKRIREIRASERRAYQKIADVFEQCSYANREKITWALKHYFIEALKNKDYKIIEKLKHEILWEENHPWWNVFEEELKSYPEIKCTEPTF